MSMAYFSSSCTQPSCFTDRIRRKIIVKHEIIKFLHSVYIILHLFVIYSSESSYRKTLCFSSGKKCAAVGPRKNIYFTGNWSYISYTPSICTYTLFQYGFPYNVIFKFLKSSENNFSFSSFIAS